LVTKSEEGMGSETGDAEGRGLRLRRSTPRSAVARLVCLGALPMTGCALSPSVNILGSFFPAWLISIVTGLVLALVVWRVLVATGIAPHLTPPTLVYPCLAALLIFASWLVLFAG
jgi:hypothetical protein